MFERYKFWQRDQRERESIDQWVNYLRILLSSCEYEDQKQSNLRDRIVFGVLDIRVKERLLRESNLNLTKALDICHAAEASKVQMKVMEGDSQQRHEVNILSKKNAGKSHRRGNNPAEANTVSHKHHTQFYQGRNNPAEVSTVSHKQHAQFYQGRNCGYFASQHPPRKCPAYGATCSKCKGRNHFAKVCKGGGFRKKIYQLETDHTDDHDGGSDFLFVGTVTDSKHPTKTEQKWQAVLNVQGHNVQFKLDTGAEANVLPVVIPLHIQHTVGQKTLPTYALR